MMHTNSRGKIFQSTPGFIRTFSKRSISMELLLLIRRSACLLVAAVMAFISGCTVPSGALFTSSPATQTKLVGRVMGGAVPMVGTTVTLYASVQSTGTSDYGYYLYSGTPNALNTATTDANGDFGTTDSSWEYSSVSCTPGQVVYLTAVSGTASGKSETNPNVVLAAVMGIAADSACDLYTSQSQCVSGQSCKTTSLDNATTLINEVTTVATAYAFSSFLDLTGTNGDVVNIAASANNSYFLNYTDSTNDVPTSSCTDSGCAVTTASGLQHAFYNYLNLVTPATSQANATPPLNAQAIAPQAVVNSIANALQYCTNSTPNTENDVDTPDDGTPCGSLYEYTPSQGQDANSSTRVATSILGAALNLARNPYGLGTTGTPGGSVAGFWDLIPGTGSAPYLPELSEQPNDWTLAIAYPVPVNPVGGQGFPFMLALDADDNVYVTSPENDPWLPQAEGTGSSAPVYTTVSSESACLFGWTSYGAFRPTMTQFRGTADDAYQNNPGNNVGPKAGYEGSGGLSTSSTWFCSGAQNSTAAVGSYTGEAYFLTTLAADNAGNLFVANYGNPGASSAGSEGIIEINVNPTISTPVGTYENSFAVQETGSTYNPPTGIAVDKFNNVWYGVNTSATTNLQALNPAVSGNYLTIDDGTADAFGDNTSRGMAFDSSGNLWVSSYGGTAVASPDYGLGGIELKGQINGFPIQGTQTSTPDNYAIATTGAPKQIRVSVGGGSTVTNTNQPGDYGVAVDHSGNVWTTAGGTNACGNAQGANDQSCVNFQSLGSSYNLGLTECLPTTTDDLVTGANCSEISALSNGLGDTTANNPTAMSPKFLEVDGDGVVWVMDSYNVGVDAFASGVGTNGTLISESTGFTPCLNVYYSTNTDACTYPDSSSSPKGIVVDSTGSVWYTTPDFTTSNTNANMLIQIVGTGTATWPLLAAQKPGEMP